MDLSNVKRVEASKQEEKTTSYSNPDSPSVKDVEVTIRIGGEVNTSDIELLERCHFKPAVVAKKKFGFIPTGGSKAVLERKYVDKASGFSAKVRCDVKDDGQIACRPIPFPLLKPKLVRECGIPAPQPPPQPPSLDDPSVTGHGHDKDSRSPGVSPGTMEVPEDSSTSGRSKGKDERRKRRKRRSKDKQRDREEDDKMKQKKDLEKSEIIQQKLMLRSLSGKTKRDRAEILDTYVKKRVHKLRYRVGKTGQTRLYQVTSAGKLAQITSGEEAKSVVEKYNVKQISSMQTESIGEGLERTHDDKVMSYIDARVAEVSYVMLVGTPSYFLFSMRSMPVYDTMEGVKAIADKLVSVVRTLDTEDKERRVNSWLESIIQTDRVIMEAAYEKILQILSWELVTSARQAVDLYEASSKTLESAIADVHFVEKVNSIAAALMDAIQQSFNDKIRDLYNSQEKSYIRSTLKALLKDVVLQCGSKVAPQEPKKRIIFLNDNEVSEGAKSAYTNLLHIQQHQDQQNQQQRQKPRSQPPPKSRKVKSRLDDMSDNDSSTESGSERYASAPSDSDDEEYDNRGFEPVKHVGAQADDKGENPSSSEDEEEEDDSKAKSKGSSNTASKSAKDGEKTQKKTKENEEKEKEKEKEEEEEKEKEEEEEENEDEDEGETEAKGTSRIPPSAFQNFSPVLVSPGSAKNTFDFVPVSAPKMEFVQVPLVPGPNPYADRTHHWESAAASHAGKADNNTSAKNTTGGACVPCTKCPKQSAVGGPITDGYNWARKTVGELPVYSKLGILDCRYPVHEVVFFDKPPYAECINLGGRCRPVGVRVSFNLSKCDNTPIFSAQGVDMFIGVHHIRSCFKSWLYEWSLSMEEMQCATMRLSKRHQLRVDLQISREDTRMTKVSTGLLVLHPSCTSGIYYLKDCNLIIHLNFQMEVAHVLSANTDPCADPCAPRPKKRIVTYSLCSVRVIEKC